jgi:hypothetical protein
VGQQPTAKEDHEGCVTAEAITKEAKVEEEEDSFREPEKPSMRADMMEPPRKKEPAQHQTGREERLRNVDHPRPPNSNGRLNDGRMTSSQRKASKAKNHSSDTAAGAEEPDSAQRRTPTSSGERRANNRVDGTTERNVRPKRHVTERRSGSEHD